MKTNKLLSVVLTLCVLLAAFSLTALAADGETHSIAVAYCVEGDENGVVEEYAAEDLQNAINEIAETAAMFEATAVKMTLQADVTGVAFHADGSRRHGIYAGPRRSYAGGEQPGQ